MNGAGTDKPQSLQISKSERYRVLHNRNSPTARHPEADTLLWSRADLSWDRPVSSQRSENNRHSPSTLTSRAELHASRTALRP